MSLDWMRYKKGDYIVLYASKLAACAGMHPYSPTEELKHEFRRSIGKNATYVKPSEQAAQVISRHQNILKVIHATYASATNVQEALDAVVKPVTTQVQPADIDAIKRLLDPRCESDVKEIDNLMIIKEDKEKIFAASVALHAAVEAVQRLSQDPEIMQKIIDEEEIVDASIVDAALTLRNEMAASHVLIQNVTRTKTETLSPVVIDHIRHVMYTNHGTQQEDVIRNNLVIKKSMIIKTCDKFKTSAVPLMTVDGIEVYIGGRHDGLMNNKIVEIKTRQRRFLGTPLYELVQVHAYMSIYGTKEAIIVESYNGQEREHPIEFDDALWSRVQCNLVHFVRDLLE